MNKLLQTTLITAILSTGVMASELPQTIESGATVYVNKDIGINGTIDNYGSIDTQITSGTYPTIRTMMMEATINNHVGQSLKEIDEPDKTTILNANKVNNETLTKAYKITEEGGGTINENIKTSGITVNTVSDGTLDFKSLTVNDLLYLGTDAEGKTIKITEDNAGETNTKNAIYRDMKYHVGDKGTDSANSYGLELSGFLNVYSDFSNYTKGSIKTTGSDSHVAFRNGGEFHVPLIVGCHTICENAGGKSCDIYGNVTVKNSGVFEIGEVSILKSGATFTIGEI